MNEISNAGIFMFIFAMMVLLTGFYMYTGHELKMISWKAGFRSLDKQGWKNVGKWTMISSLFIFMFALLAIFLSL